MMPNTLLFCAVALLGAGALPAAAQPLRAPDRMAIHEAAAAAAAAVRPAMYQQGREEQTDRQTRTLKLGPEGELVLGNVAGDITVTKGGGNEATIDIVKTARARSADEARQMLGLVDVTVSERNGRAEVRTVYSRGDDRSADRRQGDGRGGDWRERRRNTNVSVAYNVTAPAGTRLSVGSVSGTIKVTEIKGDLSISSVSGGVRIANAGRISAAKSVSGTVEILDTQVDGGIEAQSVSGNVILRKISARRVEAGSVSGDVALQDITCERVEAHSVSGTIEYAGSLARNGRYELNSHSGAVRLSVEGNSGFELEANSFSGSVRSDLPLTGEDRDRDAAPHPGRRRTLRGVHGDGSAVVSITTFSGSVVVSKR